MSYEILVQGASRAQSSGVWPTVVALMPPFASSLVAIWSLVVSTGQAKRNLELSQRQIAIAAQQAQIAERKLENDNFVHRFAVYEEYEKAANAVRTAIFEFVGDDPMAFPQEVYDQFDNAERKMYFLFGDDVVAAASAVSDALMSMLDENVEYQRLVGAARSDGVAVGKEKFFEAEHRASVALKNVRVAVRAYMLT